MPIVLGPVSHLRYLAPEWITSASGSAADQFSLAVIAYEMVTGKCPFSGDDLGKTVWSVMHQAPAPVHEVNPALSAAMWPAFSRALEKDPSNRFETCGAFVRALETAVP